VPNLPNFVVQGPIMDHMGNVTSVLRMDSSAGLAQLRPEFLYDYDAFGREVRANGTTVAANPPAPAPPSPHPVSPPAPPTPTPCHSTSAANSPTPNPG